jgi:hypothetical protein
MNVKNGDRGMEHWLKGEPSLEELLGDDMMSRVVASAGMSPAEFRSRLAEIASRLAAGAGQSGTGKAGKKPQGIAVGG